MYLQNEIGLYRLAFGLSHFLTYCVSLLNLIGNLPNLHRFFIEKAVQVR